MKTIYNLLPMLISDLNLEKKNIRSSFNEQMYDIYYSSTNNFILRDYVYVMATV